jgi:hypothetical protein
MADVPVNGFTRYDTNAMKPVVLSRLGYRTVLQHAVPPIDFKHPPLPLMFSLAAIAFSKVLWRLGEPAHVDWEEAIIT